MEEINGSLIDTISGFTALLSKKLLFISSGDVLNIRTTFFTSLEIGSSVAWYLKVAYLVFFRNFKSITYLLVYKQGHDNFLSKQVAFKLA